MHGTDPRVPPWQTGVRRDVAALSNAGRQLPARGVDSVATDHHYTVTRWDVSLANVARIMYGDPSLWPKIWLANLDLLDDPDVIRAGQRLRIPKKEPLTSDERNAAAQYEARHRR